MSPLVFVHGWALGPDFWTDISDRLPGVPKQCADLGFRGAPATPQVQHPLVIAHSMGLMWALDTLPRPWSGLIAFNSFTRFSRQGDFPGVEPRLVGRMTAKLEQAPSAVARDFLIRCGLDDPMTDGLDKDRLTQGLKQLEHGDGRDEFARLDCPVLAVAGSTDPIVTLEHATACFAPRPLTVIEGGGHLLPLTHAAWVAQRIKAALNGDWTP